MDKDSDQDVLGSDQLSVDIHENDGHCVGKLGNGNSKDQGDALGSAK